MTDIDLTAAIRPTSDAIYRQLSGQYGDFSTPSDEEAEAVLKAALPHILAQVEARVKPSREDLFAAVGEAIAGSWSDTEEYAEAPDYVTDAVLALRPGKTEREIRADMLDALIDGYFHGDANRFTLPDSVIQWLRAQPEYKARYARGGGQA